VPKSSRRDADAERAERGQLVHDTGQVDERPALHDLQLEPRRRQPAAGQRLEHRTEQSGVDQAASRQVDGDALRAADRCARPQAPSARVASPSTHRSSSTTSPLSSAAGTKAPGPTGPSRGWSQRTSASTATTSRAAVAAGPAPRSSTTGW
jgi:hypothetical protein